LGVLAFAVEVPEESFRRVREAWPTLRLDRLADPAPPDALGEVEALVAWSLTHEQLAAAPRLRWLQAMSAGVEHLPLTDLAERGIRLSNMSGVHAPNIAEHALAMMLALARRIPALVLAQRDHRWRDTATHDEVFELAGQTVVLVGLGAIGAAIAPRAAAFGMRVLGVRRNPEQALPPGVAEGFGLDRLDAALAEADHVVVSLPATPDTRGLFDAARLAAIKPGAFFYNVGRGATVDTAALTAALATGHLGGAGLDVVDPEPLPPESPLWGMANVLITAHTSGATPKYWERGVEILLDNLRRYAAGQRLQTEVDPRAGY